MRLVFLVVGAVVLAPFAGCAKAPSEQSEAAVEPSPPSARTSRPSHAPSASVSASARPYARYKSGHYILMMRKIMKGTDPTDPTTIGEVRAMNSHDYGMAPMLADEGTVFLLPSLGPDKGGHVMSFSNPEDLAKMKAYYDDLKKTSAVLFSWTAKSHNILLQADGDTPEKQWHLLEKLLVLLDDMPESIRAEVK